MQRLIAISALLALHMTTASAQSPAPPGSEALSMEQQIKVGEMLTNDGGAALSAGAFALSAGTVVPAAVQLRPVPDNVAAAAPQLRDRTYVVVEEQIAIVEPQTRKVVAVVQRWRPQNEGAK